MPKNTRVVVAACRSRRIATPHGIVAFACFLAVLMTACASGKGPTDHWPQLVDAAIIGGADKLPQPASVDVATQVRDRWLQVVRQQGKESEVDTATPKAAALCIDWENVDYIPGAGLALRFEYWFTSWGLPSLRDTRKRVIERCEAWSKETATRCDCALVTENDTLVLKVPDDVVRRYRDGLGSPQYFGEERFQLAEKRLLIADAERATAAGIVPTDPIPIRQPVNVAYPYMTLDYDSACWFLYTYAVIDAGTPDVERLTRIADIAQRGFYDCKDVPVDNAPPRDPVPQGPRGPKEPTERHCKLLKSVAIEGPLEDTVHLPRNIIDGLKSAGIPQQFHTVWVELTVRLDSDNMPIEVFPRVRPIALVSADKLLLGTEVYWPRPEWGCSVGAEFPKREILRVTCDGAACTDKPMRAMIEEVLHGMEVTPIAAKRWPHDGHPEEYQLRREIEPSLVLGGPFFEKSRYLVKLWSSNSTDATVGTRARYRGPNQGKRLFVEITQILSVAPNRLSEKYAEPSKNEVTKYDNAVVDAVNASVTRACSALAGALTGGVCEVNAGGTK